MTTDRVEAQHEVATDGPPAWSVIRPDTFSDRVVLVTGAAGGMGAETAVAFATCGAQVVAVDLSADRVREILRRCPGRETSRHLAVGADLATSEGIDRVFAAVDTLGRLDHVAACAAVITAVPSMQMDRHHWRHVFDINVAGSFFVAQEAYRRMLPAKSGTIVLVGSDAGKRGGGGLIADTAYAASKASVLSMVKSLAREFAGSEIRINALTPGPSDTPMHSEISAELKARIGANLPIGRMGRPDEMAAMILFLSSPGSSFSYGASFNVDGGSLFE